MATMQELRGEERGGEKTGEKREGEEKWRNRRRRKRILLNRIFNHSLSFAAASQSFTIAQERRRGRRIGGGEGRGENMRGERKLGQDRRRK